MISGVVTLGAADAVVDVTIYGSAGARRVVHAVIDTGFNGWLILPPAVLAELGLVVRGEQHAVLADGSRASISIYEAIVDWDGRTLPVAAHAGATAMIGMALLRGYELTVQVTDGGEVRITAL